MRQVNHTDETKRVYETPVFKIVEVGQTQMLAQSSEWIPYDSDEGEPD